MSMPKLDEIVEIYAKAIAGGYAVPHINHSDFGDLIAITESGQEAHTPIVAAATLMTVEALGMDRIAAIAKLLAREMDTPLILHLDHSPSHDACIKAIDCGYNSVMIDGSDKPLEENIAITKSVVDYAHARGVFVEAEVGHVARGGDTASWSASVDEAVRLVERTGVDSLAVSIGNEHGFYKNPPILNFALLSQIHEVLPEVPLVLHGGSGIPVADVRHAISFGIRKVNVGTDVRCTYVAGLRDAIAEMGIERHTGDIVKFARERAKQKIAEVIDMCWAMDRA